MNNFEIGLDIEKIKRFDSKEDSKNKNFLEKIFTQKELDYCFSKNDVSTHLAGRYAAKEAVVKALSSNYEKKLIYNEIEIINNSSGVPEVVILKPELNNLKIKISISHTEDNAIAMAIIIH